MKSKYLLILVLLHGLFFVAVCQNNAPTKKQTVPLGSFITVSISKWDTIDCYKRYFFTYKNGKKKVKGSFIVEKSADTLKLDKSCQVKLCRNISFCSIRGCYVYNGIYIDGKEFIHFDEYSERPTLKLCDVKK